MRHFSKSIHLHPNVPKYLQGVENYFHYYCYITTSYTERFYINEIKYIFTNSYASIGYLVAPPGVYSICSSLQSKISKNSSITSQLHH